MEIDKEQLEKFGDDTILIDGNALFCDACGFPARAEKTHFTACERGLHWICRVCDSEFYIKNDDEKGSKDEM